MEPEDFLRYVENSCPPASWWFWITEDGCSYKFVAVFTQGQWIMVTLTDEESGTSYSLLSNKYVFSDPPVFNDMIKAMIEQVRGGNVEAQTQRPI